MKFRSWLITGMLIMAVTMGCTGQRSGTGNEPDPYKLALNADECRLDISDTTSTVVCTVAFMMDVCYCTPWSDLVGELRKNFSAYLHQIDSTAVVPEYRNDAEVFITPCLGPEVSAVYQCDRSDSAFTATMIERYINPDANEPSWWFDPCRTDWSPEHCQLNCSAGTVSYFRLDTKQKLFFRFWQRVGGDPVFIEVDGITKHKRRCRGDYYVSVWVLRTFRTYTLSFDDGSDGAEEDSIGPAIKL